MRKRLVKKAIALIESAAIAVTLMSGMVFTDITKVSATTDGKLTLNVGTKVVSNGGDKTYSFSS